MGTRLTDHISNSRLYEVSSILLSKAIMRERLRWLGHVLWMKDGRLPKIFLFSQPSKAKPKACRPRSGVSECHKGRKEDLRETGTSNREALHILG